MNDVITNYRLRSSQACMATPCQDWNSSIMQYYCYFIDSRGLPTRLCLINPRRPNEAPIIGEFGTSVCYGRWMSSCRQSSTTKFIWRRDITNSVGRWTWHEWCNMLSRRSWKQAKYFAKILVVKSAIFGSGFSHFIPVVLNDGWLRNTAELRLENIPIETFRKKNCFCKCNSFVG